MNCDEVFEFLVSSESGPTMAVQEHLASCPRCRDMTEAMDVLRGPLSVNGLVSSVSPTGSNLPSAEAVWIAEESAARLKLASGGDERTSLNKRRPGLKYVSAFLAGAVASLGIAAALRSEPTVMTRPANQLCLWNVRAESTSPSNEVVLSCVACHLAAPTHH